MAEIPIKELFVYIGQKPVKHPTDTDIRRAYILSGKSRQDVADYFCISVHSAKDYIYRPPQKKHLRIQIMEYLQNV